MSTTTNSHKQEDDHVPETNSNSKDSGAAGAAHTVTPQDTQDQEQDHNQPHKADPDPGQPPSEI